MDHLPEQRLRTDIPNYDHAVVNFIGSIIDKFISLDPFLGRFPKQKSVHTGPIRNVRGEKNLDQEFSDVKATANINFQDIKKSNFDSYTAFISQFSEQMIITLRQEFLLSLNPVLELSGQTIKSSRETLSYDTYLDTLEIIDMEFDENGEPILPEMIGPPNLKDKMKQITKEHEMRERKIIAKKREEYYAKKRYRRLSRSS